MATSRLTVASATFAVFAFSVAVVGNVSAQSTPVTVAELRTPASPGFVVLGIEPTAIQRPVSPRAVGLSLVSAVADGDNLIPKNYGLEIAPYWLQSRPLLTYRNWNRTNVWNTMLQSLSVSFATTSVAAEGDQAASTGIGFGIRTVLLKGRESPEAVQARETILTLLAELNLVDIPPDVPNEDLTETEGAARTEAQQRLAALSARVREQSLLLQTENQRRVGWVLELAAGAAGRIQDQDFEERRLTRYGFWATPGYQLETRAFNVLGVVRYQRDREAINLNLFDVGGRLQVDARPLAVSAEVVRRVLDQPTDADMDSTRVVGILDYQINDDLYLTASFGKDYRNMMTGKSGLVTFLGLNLGLGRRPTLAF